MINQNKLADFLIGLAVGGFLGAGAALLMAPQSGQRTREQLRSRSIDIKQTTEQDIAEAQARIKKTAVDLRRQIDDLRQRLAEIPDRAGVSLKEQANKARKLAEEAKVKVTQ